MNDLSKIKLKCYHEAIYIFTQCHKEITEHMIKEKPHIKYEDNFFHRKYHKCIDEHIIDYKACLQAQ